MTLTEKLLTGLLSGGLILMVIFSSCGIIAYIIACIKKIWDIIKK